MRWCFTIMDSAEIRHALFSAVATRKARCTKCKLIHGTERSLLFRL